MNEILKITNNFIFVWFIMMITIFVTPYLSFGGWLWSKTTLDGFHKLMRCRPYRFLMITIVLFTSSIGFILSPSDYNSYFIIQCYLYSIILWVQSFVIYRLRKHHMF